MRLIKQTRLFFKSGNSDKVYEVDLCELAEDQYIVNFRYGRRGKSLKDGTKTDSPVDEAKAQDVFDSLVASKMKKGYQTTLPSDDEPELATPPKKINKSAREKALARRLTEKNDSDWSIERIIWRVGEIEAKSVIPHVLDFVGENPLRDYCIAWTIGRCKAREGLPVLEKFCAGEFAYKVTPECDKVRRMALYATLEIMDEGNRAAVNENLKRELPEDLSGAINEDSRDKIFFELTKYLNDDNFSRFEVLDTLYAIDSPAIRDALYEFLKGAELKPNAFKAVRHIYKMSEFRKDSLFWALFAYRFEKDKEMYRMPDYSYGDKIYISAGDYNYKTYNKSDLKKADAPLAYSSKTRSYLRRRSWRFLKKLGLENDAKYAEIAKSLLILFTDDDAVEPAEYTYFKYDQDFNYETISTWRDKFAYYMVFNYILYGNSPRYKLPPNANSWVCDKSYKPGGPVPKEREESFSFIWDENPDCLLELLNESACEEVHHFAVKAIRGNLKFLKSIDLNIILNLVSAKYEVTARFAFEFIKKNVERSDWDYKILKAFINCPLEEARKEACAFIDENRSDFIENSDLFVLMASSKYGDVRDSFTGLIASMPLDDRTMLHVFGKLIPVLQNMVIEKNEFLGEIVDFIIETLSDRFKLVDMTSILTLLDNSEIKIQELGAAILLKQDLGDEDIPDDLMDRLLNSKVDNIRVIAIQLLGQFSENVLRERVDLLLSLITQKNEGVRKAVRPILARISSKNPSFAREVRDKLLKILIRGRVNQEALAEISDLMREELLPSMRDVDASQVYKLLTVKVEAAHPLGQKLLENFSYRDFPVSQIVTLANHGFFDVREKALSMLMKDPLNVKKNMFDAVKVLDVQWDDVRETVFDFFRERFTEQDFSTEILILICDSIHEHTQLFGRELLMKHFDSKDGVDYLIKLSEHPGGNMRLFVSSFLFNYAADNPDHIRSLIPYFKRSLMQINQGRAVKKRIFSFCSQEALKSKEAAEAIADLISGLSNTVSVETKSSSLTLLLEIKKKYPDIDLSIRCVETETRHAL